MNQTAKFGPINVLGLMKRMNGLDFVNGPHRSQESRSNALGLFTNILENMMSQRFILNYPAILGLLKMINGLDRDYGTHKVGFQ